MLEPLVLLLVLLEGVAEAVPSMIASGTSFDVMSLGAIDLGGVDSAGLKSAIAVDFFAEAGVLVDEEEVVEEEFEGSPRAFRRCLRRWTCMCDIMNARAILAITSMRQ